MFETIKNFLKEDLKKSIKSPTIIVACLIIGVGVFFVVSWHYEGLFESQKLKHSGIVEAQSIKYNTIVKEYEVRLHGINEYIKFKDDLIVEYRERLGLIPAGGNRYSTLTHDELKEEASNLVEKIREVNLEYNQKKRNLDNTEQDQMRSAESDEKRTIVWHRFRKLSIQLSFEYDMKFEKSFGSDLILIRDEILKRIPEQKKGMIKIASWNKYRWLIKSAWMDEIVMDLELLAKNLNP